MDGSGRQPENTVDMKMGQWDKCHAVEETRAVTIKQRKLGFCKGHFRLTGYSDRDNNMALNGIYDDTGQFILTD